MTSFAPLPGAGGRYVVSSEGVVYGPQKELRGRPDHTGRLAVSIAPHRGDRQKNKYVHVAVLEAFVGPRPEGHDVDHVNRDYTDNRLSNLRWWPTALNRGDGGRRGGAKSRAPGERNGRSKLTGAQRRDILRARAEGVPARDLAREHHVSASAIYRLTKAGDRS